MKFAAVMLACLTMLSSGCGGNDKRSVAEPTVDVASSICEAGMGAAIPKATAAQVAAGPGSISPFNKWVNFPAGTVLLRTGNVPFDPSVPAIMALLPSSPSAALTSLDGQLSRAGFKPGPMSNGAKAAAVETPAAERFLRSEQHVGNDPVYVDRQYSNGKDTVSFEMTLAKPQGICVVLISSVTP